MRFNGSVWLVCLIFTSGLSAWQQLRYPLTKEESAACEEILMAHGGIRSMFGRAEIDRIKKARLVRDGEVYVVYQGTMVRAKLRGVRIDSTYDPINPVIVQSGTMTELERIRKAAAADTP